MKYRFLILILIITSLSCDKNLNSDPKYKKYIGKEIQIINYNYNAIWQDAREYNWFVFNFEKKEYENRLKQYYKTKIHEFTKDESFIIEKALIKKLPKSGVGPSPGIKYEDVALFVCSLTSNQELKFFIRPDILIKELALLTYSKEYFSIEDQKLGQINTIEKYYQVRKFKFKNEKLYYPNQIELAQTLVKEGHRNIKIRAIQYLYSETKNPNKYEQDLIDALNDSDKSIVEEAIKGLLSIKTSRKELIIKLDNLLYKPGSGTRRLINSKYLEYILKHAVNNNNYSMFMTYFMLIHSRPVGDTMNEGLWSAILRGYCLNDFAKDNLRVPIFTTTFIRSQIITGSQYQREMFYKQFDIETLECKQRILNSTKDMASLKLDDQAYLKLSEFLLPLYLKGIADQESKIKILTLDSAERFLSSGKGWNRNFDILKKIRKKFVSIFIQALNDINRDIVSKALERMLFVKEIVKEDKNLSNLICYQLKKVFKDDSEIQLIRNQILKQTKVDCASIKTNLHSKISKKKTSDSKFYKCNGVYTNKPCANSDKKDDNNIKSLLEKLLYGKLSEKIEAQKEIQKINDTAIIPLLVESFWKVKKDQTALTTLVYNIWRLDKDLNIALEELIKNDVNLPNWHYLWLYAKNNELVLNSIKLLENKDQKIRIKAIKLLGRFAGSGAVRKAKPAIKPLMREIAFGETQISKEAIKALQKISSGYSYHLDYCPYYRNLGRSIKEKKELLKRFSACE